MYFSKRTAGFTLIEILVGTALFVLFAGGMYESTRYVFKVVYQSRVRILEDQILNEQIEMIRNYAFDEVGIINGVPAGLLDRVVTTTRNNIIFEITRTVRNVDDPYDGTIAGTPADLAPVDYKFVDVSVVCTDCNQKKAVTMSTIIAPKYLEGDQSTGALFISVFDANGSAIQGASVRVVATSTSPTVDYTDTTDNAGKLNIVGLAAGYEAYAITVTKDGYTTDQTMPRSQAVPNPAKPPVSIIAQAVTQMSFSLDYSSTIVFSSMNSICEPIASASFTVKGAKLVGTNPDVLAVNSSVTTDGSGSYTTTSLTWDNYTFTPLSYNLLGTIPASPVILQPGVNQPVTLLLGTNYSRSLLVTVRDSVTLEPLSNASVTLALGGYNQTESTGVGHMLQTDWSGGSGQTTMTDSNKYASDDGGVDVTGSAGNLMLAVAGNGYVTDGTLESSTFDLGVAANFVNIDWEPFSQPSAVGDNGIRFQIATASSTVSEWNYVGYDGTSATYYDASHVAINAMHNGDNYVRYKVYLHTDDTASTPTLSDVTISYTTACTPPGQAYFGNLSAGDYNLTASLADHMTYDETVTISGKENVIINMIAQSTIAGDTVAPAIDLSAPADSAAVSGSAVPVSAIASDNIGMAGVQFKLDGVNLQAEDVSSPFAIVWNTTSTVSGAHTLTGVARDLAGNLTTSAPVAVTVMDVTPPTVSLTAPANGATVSGSSVSMTATAADFNGVVGVRFKMDQANIGAEDTASPYSISWDSTAVAPGSHSLTAVARDAAGNITTSTASVVTVSDVIAPTVSLTAPANDANVSGSAVSVTATASDNVGVVGVQFKVDTNTKIGAEDTTSPYSISWDSTTVTPGAHSLVAVVRDAVGNVTTSTVTNITVFDVAAPTVAMAAPANNASVSGSAVTVSATASDNVAVVGVRFKVDSVNIGAEDTTSPYSITWDSTAVAPGSHALVAVGRDAAGNMTTSTVVNVTVLDVTAPTVSIAAPVNNSLVNGSGVTVSATASDNVAVAGVQFKLDGVNLSAEDTTSPYSIVWNSTQTADGVHTLTAVARDAAGNQTTSASVTVTVTDMIAYWKVDEGSGTTAGDATGNGNFGTLQNSPSWVAGHAGNALSFDGNNDAVDIPVASAFNNLGAFSVSAWIKPTSMGEGGEGRIVDKANGTGPTNGWYFRLDDTNNQNFLVFSVDYSGGGSANLVRKSAAGAVAANAWQHVTVTWDGSTTATHVHMYVNGTEVSYGTTTNGAGTRASDAAEGVKIGNDKSRAKTFVGIIDDVRVYNRVLSASEVTDVYNGRAW